MQLEKDQATSSSKNEYFWQGYDSKANKVSGLIRANSLDEAKEYLNEGNIYLKSIKKKQRSILNLNQPISSFTLFKKDYSTELYYFTTQLYSLLNAGLNLEKAIFSIQKTIKVVKIKKILAEIHFDLTRGHSFESSLEKHPEFFPKIYITLIKVASQGRKFNKTVKNLASYLRKKNHLNQEIKKAVFYPKVILFISIVLSLILLVKVIPVFEKIYQNSNSISDLPAFSQFIINLSNFLINQFQVLIFAVLVLYLLFKIIKQSKIFQEIFGRFILIAPAISDLVIKSNVAMIFRMIATLDQGKLNLIYSINLVADNCSHYSYKKALKEIALEIQTGGAISQAFAKYPIFPEYAIQMISTGENTNQLGAMLGNIATIYESEVSDALEKLKTLIEPMTMVVLSVIVASIVIGMYLPIFSMGATF